MLTLRRQSIEIRDKDKNLFLNLHLDTELVGYFSGLDRIFRGEFKITKPWTGEVNTNEKRFKIMRTRTSFLTANVSLIVIKGNETIDGTQRKLDVSFGAAWYTIVSFILGTLFLMAIATFYFEDIWGWLLVSSIWTLQVLLIILDLNKTDYRFKQYIEDVKK